MVDRTKSLKDLEGTADKHVRLAAEDWWSALMSTCERLCEKPLKDFATEDLRVMIGQELGIEFLASMALERLATNPFEQGDYYPGDLLTAVLRLPASYWRQHQDLYSELAAIVQGALSTLDILMPDIKRFRHSLPPHQGERELAATDGQIGEGFWSPATRNAAFISAAAVPIRVSRPAYSLSLGLASDVQRNNQAILTSPRRDLG